MLHCKQLSPLAKYPGMHRLQAPDVHVMQPVMYIEQLSH